MQHAFTRKYNQITNVLTDEVEVSFNGKSIKLNNAIWDTGASTSAINIKYAEELGLKPVSYVNIGTANGSCTVPVFYIDIRFNKDLGINGITVSGSNLGGVDMLLGMDIIGYGQFTISNNTEGTTISFISPSNKTIDYVQELKDKEAKLLKKMGRNNLCPCGSGKKIKDCCGRKFDI